MKKLNYRAALLTGATLLAGLPTTQAFAQDTAPAVDNRGTLQDIVVTARRREENLQDTPIAVTAVNSAMIEAHNIRTFVDMSQITPNVKIADTPGGIGAAAIYMRGIGYADNIIGNDAPFGFYIDGVPYGRIATAAMDIVEPASIQVLRGPQGTLFGRNTTGGAIVVQTHVPTDDFSGSVRGTYGSFEDHSISARIDTGLIKGSSIKASFAYKHQARNGIQDNVGQPGYLDLGSQTSDAYWGKVQGEWGGLKATLSADYTKMGGVPVQIQVVDATPTVKAFFANSVTLGGNTIPITEDPLFRINNYTDPLPQRIVQKGLALTLEYALNDHLKAKVIGGLRAYRRDDTNNYGPSDLRGYAITAAQSRTVPYSQWTSVGVLTSWKGWYGFDERYQTQNQRTLEAQLLGNYDTFDFVVGGFYFDEKAHDFGTTHLPYILSPQVAIDSISYRDYSVHSKSKAAFAQVDYRPAFLDNKLELTGGIRYTDDSRDFVQVQPLTRQLPLSGDNWSYLLSASYKFTTGLMGYVKYSTGYRAGGFNARTTSPAISPIYQPEKIRAWEAGFKFESSDRRIRLNVAAFYNKYKDLQVNQFAPPSGGVGAANVSVNANAKYKGVEVEGTIIPVDGLTLSGTYGYVKPVYESYPYTAATTLPGCTYIAMSGSSVLQDCAAVTQFINTPKTQWSADATYQFPQQYWGQASLSVTYSWTASTSGTIIRAASAFPNSLDNASYGLLGARLAVTKIPLSDGVTGTLSLFGHNLTDRRYSIGSIDFGFLGTKNFPDRRTMGIEAKVDF